MLSGTVLPASRTHIATSSGRFSWNRSAARSSAAARGSGPAASQAGWAANAAAIAASTCAALAVRTVPTTSAVFAGLRIGSAGPSAS